MEKLLLPSALTFNVPNIDVVYVEDVSKVKDETTWLVMPFEGCLYHSLANNSSLAVIDEVWCSYVESLYDIYKANSQKVSFKSLNFGTILLDRRKLQLAGVSHLLANSYSTSELSRASNIFQTIVKQDILANATDLRTFVESIDWLEDVESIKTDHEQQKIILFEELEKLQSKYEDIHDSNLQYSKELEALKNAQVELEKKIIWLRKKKADSEASAVSLEKSYQQEIKSVIEKNNKLRSQEIEAQNSVLQEYKKQVEDLDKYAKSISIKLDRERKNNEKLKRELALKELALMHSRSSLRSLENNKAVKASKSLRTMLSKVINNNVQDLEDNINLLKDSPLFNSEWYLKQYPDTQGTQIEAEEHYATTGYLEGKQPSENFDGLSYLKAYPDVANQGINPLIHYLRYGKKEGRVYQSNLLGLVDGKNDDQ